MASKEKVLDYEDEEDCILENLIFMAVDRGEGVYGSGGDPFILGIDNPSEHRIGLTVIDHSLEGNKFKSAMKFTVSLYKIEDSMNKISEKFDELFGEQVRKTASKGGNELSEEIAKIANKILQANIKDDD